MISSNKYYSKIFIKCLKWKYLPLGVLVYMVRYGAQGESTVQYCGTIVVHGTVRGTARRMRSWYICMVRYGTVRYSTDIL